VGTLANHLQERAQGVPSLALRCRLRTLVDRSRKGLCPSIRCRAEDRPGHWWRRWRRHTHTVLACEDGFGYEGQAIGASAPGVRQLSAVARIDARPPDLLLSALLQRILFSPLVLLSHKIRHRVFVYLSGRKMWYLDLSFSGSGDRNGWRIE
jgi:hypothetical protein